ncbi:MAG TPA: hypothetical protein VHU15_15365 [Stellaceae bacterium]|jgi:hypothetical protein|nr:hypothetical protein [Stellaceae bacterium]
MRAISAVALAAALALAGCGRGPAGEGSGPERKCPVPIPYSKAQLDEIQKAIHDLPKDSILHQVMRDYENERDDLRFCK